MSTRPSFPPPDPIPSDAPRHPEDTGPGAIPPAASIQLTQNELMLLLEFLTLLDQWDHKTKIT